MARITREKAHIIARCSFIALNVLCMLCGLFLIYVTGDMFEKVLDMNTLRDGLPVVHFAVCLLPMGIIMVILPFFGFCVALYQPKACSFLYGVFSLVLFCLLGYTTLWSASVRCELLNTTNTILDRAWALMAARKSITTLAEDIQLDYKCCGKNSCEEYIAQLSATNPIPNSCCGDKYKLCPVEECKKKPGCYETFTKYWFAQTSKVFKIGLSMLMFEFVLIICTVAYIFFILLNDK